MKTPTKQPGRSDIAIAITVIVVLVSHLPAEYSGDACGRRDGHRRVHGSRYNSQPVKCLRPVERILVAHTAPVGTPNGINEESNSKSAAKRAGNLSGEIPAERAKRLPSPRLKGRGKTRHRNLSSSLRLT